MHGLIRTLIPTFALSVAIAGCTSNTQGTDETTLSAGEMGSSSSETGEDLGEICDGEEPGEPIVINSPDDFEQFLGIECIPGKLIIDQSVEELLTLEGLESVKEIGQLEIRYNKTLESVIGLNNVTRIGELLVFGTVVLPDLSGFQSLTHVDTYVEIRDNQAITSLTGLELVTSSPRITIRGNDELVDFTGLHEMASIRKLEIVGNAKIENMNGFTALLDIEDDLLIEENDALTSLDGFTILQSVGGNIFISTNPMLPTCVAQMFSDSVPDKGGATVCNNNLVDNCGDKCD